MTEARKRSRTIMCIFTKNHGSKISIKRGLNPTFVWTQDYPSLWWYVVKMMEYSLRKFKICVIYHLKDFTMIYVLLVNICIHTYIYNCYQSFVMWQHRVHKHLYWIAFHKIRRVNMQVIIFSSWMLRKNLNIPLESREQFYCIESCYFRP